MGARGAPTMIAVRVPGWTIGEASRIRNGGGAMRRIVAIAAGVLLCCALGPSWAEGPAATPPTPRSSPTAVLGPPEGRGFAPVAGTRLFYEIRGQGEPVVLIHGGQLDSRMWDDQFEPYSREFRVLRYDVRGFGGSPPAETVYSNEEDLAALLDYVGFPKAHLVGLSLGGGIAIDFALAHPDRVLSLSLAGPGLAGFEGGEPDEDQRFYAILRAARDQGPDRANELWLKDPYMAPAMENPRLAPRLRLLSAENGHVWLRNYMLERSPQPPAAKRIGEIKAPTLLVLGGRDVPTIKKIVEALGKAVPGARTVGIPGAGHMVNMEKPEEFDRAVLAFLRGFAGNKP